MNFDDFIDLSIYNTPSPNLERNSKYQKEKIEEQKIIISKLTNDNEHLNYLLERYIRMIENIDLIKLNDEKYLGNLYSQVTGHNAKKEKLEDKCEDIKKRLEIFRQHRLCTFYNICDNLRRDKSGNTDDAEYEAERNLNTLNI